MSKEQEITPPLSKEGLMGYFTQFLDGERGMASAEVLADLMLNAVQEERQACAATVRQIAGAWAEANGISDYPLMNEIVDTIERRGKWWPHLPPPINQTTGDVLNA